MKMNTIFMNSQNKLTDKLHVRIGEKSIALSNLSMYNKIING